MKLFGRALQGNDYPDYKELLEFAVKRGYVVHESCNTKEVKQFLQTKPDHKDFSKTFYKSWEDVKNMSRYEQFLDQIIYYYTGFNPNNLVESELPKVLFENLKPILSITAEEACTKCEDMLASGIALAKDTILAIFDVFDKCKYDKLSINKIKNREARLIAFKRLNQLPTETNEFLRYLIYIVTEDTTLIKNKEMLNKITKSGKDVSALINSFGVSKLSSIYGRYKLIFMAFKHANKSNISCINKLTKKSKKSINKPKQIDSDYFQTLLSNKETLDEVKLSVKLADLNNYKKIALLETINMYLMLNHNYRVFSIRNSKIWIKLSEEKKKEERMEDEPKKEDEKVAKISFPLPFKSYKTSKKPFQAKDKETLNKIYTIVYESLVSSLRSKYLHSMIKSFKLPDKCTLTAPRSEKAFVGEYPFGSSLSLVDSNLVIGISWDKEDNARDIDLSLLNMNYEKIGWNSRFKDTKSKILFSGDVVQPPGTELIYAENGFDFDSVVCVNLYGGVDESKDATFKFFVASEKIEQDKMVKNYMIDPNNVLFSTKIKMESKEMLIGFLASGKFIFSTFRSNDSRVSDNDKLNMKLIEFNLAIQKCHLNLKKLLLDAGFNESTEEDSLKFDSKADMIGFFKN
jgi:hypothetical protein